MKYITLIFLFLINFSYSQEIFEAEFLKSIPLKAETFIGIDNFENYYFTRGTTFYKKTPTETLVYANTQLDAITSVDITNPLKIVLFYRDFNTIVILDNKLNELTGSINLTTEAFAKNVAFVNISSENNLWLYSFDDTILSLWNYETKQTVFNTQPLSFFDENFEVNMQFSNYGYCWLVSKTGMLQFNQYGSFIKSIELAAIENVKPYLNGFIYVTENKIYYDNTTSKVVLIANATHKLDDFTVIKNNLYFFDANVLYKYTILKK